MAPRGESTSRIWVALLHFITWIPLGWLASHAGEMFDNMRVNPIPANIDHGSVLYKGLGLVTVASCFTFAWWPLTFFFMINIPNRIFLQVLSVFDFALFAVMLSGSIVLSLAIPHSKYICGAAEQWMASPGNPSLFTFLGVVRDWTPRDVCDELLNVWIFSILYIIILLFSSAFTFLASLSPWARVQHHIAMSYVGNLKRIHDNNPRPRKNPTSNSSAQSTQFLKLLQPPFLPQIAKHLHYNDIGSLRQTSRSVYAALTPTPSFIYESTCTPGSKAQCWSCGAQICSGCTETSAVTNPLSTPHLKHCSPRCRACFKQLCMSKPKQAQCRCFSPRTNSDVRAGIYVAGARGNRGYYNSQNTYPVRDVCKRCKVMTADELVKKRELREIKQARDTAKGWGRCDICLKEFDKEGGKLDKFWVCGSECCGGECRWDGHKI